MWQRLRWPPSRSHGEDTTIGIASAVEVDDAMEASGTFKPPGPRSALERRLEEIEGKLAEVYRRTKAVEETAATNAASIGELRDDLHGVAESLRSTEARLRRLVEAAEVGNVTARSLIAVALFVGVPFATWADWIGDHAFWPALTIAGLLFAGWLGSLVARRARRRHERLPAAVNGQATGSE